MTMNLTVMTAAERHGELVADLATERPALGKTQVMGVAGFTTADQTSLLCHKAHMVAIADTPRLGMRENRFVDRLATGFSFWFRRVGFRNRLDRLDCRHGFRTMLRGGQPLCVMDGEGLKLGTEGLFDLLPERMPSDQTSAQTLLSFISAGAFTEELFNQELMLEVRIDAMADRAVKRLVQTKAMKQILAQAGSDRATDRSGKVVKINPPRP